MASGKADIWALLPRLPIPIMSLVGPAAFPGPRYKRYSDPDRLGSYYIIFSILILMLIIIVYYYLILIRGL